MEYWLMVLAFGFVGYSIYNNRGNILDILEKPNRIKLGKGLYWEEETQTLVFTGDATIRCEGSLIEEAKQDIVRRSAIGREKHREGKPGIPYGIWDNPVHYDAEGRPLESILVYNEEGHKVCIPFPLTVEGHKKLDTEGMPVLPEGYTLCRE